MAKKFWRRCYLTSLFPQAEMESTTFRNKHELTIFTSEIASIEAIIISIVSNRASPVEIQNFSSKTIVTLSLLIIRLIKVTVETAGKTVEINKFCAKQKLVKGINFLTNFQIRKVLETTYNHFYKKIHI